MEAKLQVITVVLIIHTILDQPLTNKWEEHLKTLRLNFQI